LITESGGSAFSYTVDLTSRQKIYEAARLVKDQIGSVSILINNAGIVSGSSILETPDEKIIRTFDVNVLAHFWTIKSFMPDMIVNKKGHIVNIASLAGHSGTHKLVDYCSSKFAAVGLDEALKVELKVQGHSDYIITTVVCPYYISTGMFAGVASKVHTKHHLSSLTHNYAILLVQ
jgi:all-trans-retinol dehydrogenase (NAD+)